MFGFPQEVIDEERDFKESLIDSPRECLHEFAHGYVAEPIIFCKKCNKDIGDLYSYKVYGTHKLVDGHLVIDKEKSESYEKSIIGRLKLYE
jgi:tRNA U34 2-thiouridine synthase MnmA/TrmU